MMNKRFPSYATAEIAAKWGCHSCCTPLDPNGFEDSGYPEGSGRFAAKCSRCQSWTFVDLSKSVAALNKLSIYATHG
jgi:hypothetical protein